MEMQISSIDLGIIFFYFLIVLGLGFWFARKNKTEEDLFLAGEVLGGA